MLSEAIVGACVVWAGALALHLAYYLAATGIVVAILLLFWNRGLSKRKIQRRAWSRGEALREIAASLRAVLVFSAITAAVQLGAMAGWFTILRFNSSEILYLVVTVAAMLVGQDAYFYWTHRLMHHRLLFRRFHRTHHKSVTPSAFAAYSFDIPEAAVHGSFVPLWLCLVPMHEPGLLIFLGVMVLRTAAGHCGVELFPARWAGTAWFGWILPNVHHDLHHTSAGYNFGLYFTWWDRLMETEHPNYREQMRALSSGGSPDRPGEVPA